MADELDTALRRLALEPHPGALAKLEHRVMMRIETEVAARAAQPSLGVGVGIAAVALVIGFTTASGPVEAYTPPLELSVFSANAALAPATLLATAR